MKVILSPAKNMRIVKMEVRNLTTPGYMEKTQKLAALLKTYSPMELESLMKINPSLAADTFVDLQNWSEDKQETPALFAYHGLQYKNMDPDTFTDEDITFANDTLRILSGFYGILKACDRVCPYRLEMQCRLDVDGSNLYDFWGTNLWENLYFQGEEEPVINLASKEYYSAITPYLTSGQLMITCDFKIYRGGKYKTLATEAKMARGQMTRYIIKNRITEPEDLKSFQWNGYIYEEDMSKVDTYVFIKR